MALALAAAGTVAAAAYLDARWTISKDLRAVRLLRTSEREWAKALKNKKANCFYLFEETVKNHPDIECIWSRSGVYSWAQVYTRVCQYGNYFLSLGVEPESVVAVYLQNAPDFLFIWYGLLSIGCAPALINYNLASAALVHCVKTAGASILLADSDEGCQNRIKGSEGELVSGLGVQIVVLSEDLRNEIASSNSTRPTDSYREKGQGKTPVALIYTSGTTGFAKAVPFPMQRMYATATAWKDSAFQKVGVGGDRWYQCMPLYHGTAGISSFQGLASGVSTAIGRKFSTRTFWKDVRDSKSTIFAYVGETARYLLAAPPSPDDRNHGIRAMFGNGLRPDVWSRFQDRFGVSEVYEFFNSTEGMLALGIWSRSGFGRATVGHHGLLLRLLMHGTYIPVMLDPNTGDVWRDPGTGFAKRVSYDKGGEILVKIPDTEAFPGYFKAEKETNKKFANDVFKKGDLYYRTGDALRRTDDGFWYFLDRLGDTFRWKGENVSTAEVAHVLGRYPGVSEANVYGVLLPQHDGRAGCAAVNIEPSALGSFDWKDLAAYSRQRLPNYAVPVFIRVMKGEVGGLSSHNNKQDKVKLRDEGVDPGKRGQRVPQGEADEMYWLPSKSSGYVRFQAKDWQGIDGGRVKL